MEFKQALIISDSVGAPRKEPLLTYYKNTWVSKVENYLLTEKNTKTFAYTQRAADSSHVLNKLGTQLSLYEPDIVILQIGICDCAPRALKDKELRIIKNIPMLNKFIHRYIKKNYAKISEKRNLCYIDQDSFKDNIAKIYQNFSASHLIVLPIGTPNLAYQQKSPRIFQRVAHYNNILKESLFQDNQYFLQEFQELAEQNLESIYTDDNYHFNFYGHDLLAETIIKKLNNIYR